MCWHSSLARVISLMLKYTNILNQYLLSHWKYFYSDYNCSIVQIINPITTFTFTHQKMNQIANQMLREAIKIKNWENFISTLFWICNSDLPFTTLIWTASFHMVLIWTNNNLISEQILPSKLFWTPFIFS